MSRGFDVGDRIVCISSGIVGICTKIYVPTACGEQTMVRTDDGRMYHAPSGEWRRAGDASIEQFWKSIERTPVLESLFKELEDYEYENNKSRRSCRSAI